MCVILHCKDHEYGIYSSFLIANQQLTHNLTI